MTEKMGFIEELTNNDKEVINKREIKKEYKELMNSEILFRKNRVQFERLQDRIKLKFSYLCLIKILEDYNDEYEVDKKDLIDKSEQVFASAISYKEVLREKNKSKCTYINPYQNLLLGNSANKINIIRGYERQLTVVSKMLDLELTKNEIDPKEIIESYATYLLQNQSFEVLLDPIEKRRIDEEILIQFNPNQEKLYVQDEVKDLMYYEEKDNDIYKMNNRFNDVILFQKIGTLQYGKSFENKFVLQNYRIRKEYVSIAKSENEIPEREYNIFTYLDLDKLTNDSEFTALHADILFSDLNLEEAKKHNAGYIGEIVQGVNGKFDVHHYKDRICACKEYKRYLG